MQYSLNHPTFRILLENHNSNPNQVTDNLLTELLFIWKTFAHLLMEFSYMNSY